MRLIDADKFKQQIAAIVIRDNLVTGKGTALCELIDRQPTAYDVDKVVEWLDEYAHSEICNSHKGCPYKDNKDMHCENCGAMGTLEIVKSGGIE